MTFDKKLNIELGNAICYSGYREGQSPVEQTFPTYEQIKEDLLILEGDWRLLRLYDSGKHAQTVIEVIKNEQMDFKVMIGTCLEAEVNNNCCPWGACYTVKQIEKNKKVNKEQIEKMIKLANSYPDIVFAVSAGNEATVEWTDHLVPVDNIIKYVKMLKKEIEQPITFCENYVPWQGKLKKLAHEVDFISLHTYPVWEYKTIEEALDYTKENYYSVANKYPNKPVIITEAGWATNSNGRGISPENTNQKLQEIYCKQIIEWSKNNDVLTFVFEAFDETWKGSEDPMEPEKHWGLFTIDRKPKKVAYKLCSELI